MGILRAHTGAIECSVNHTPLLTPISDLPPQNVSLVVHVPRPLLQVELDPVVEANHVLLSSRLPDKDVLESRRV